MRKFQYLVTINLDDEYLLKHNKEDIIAVLEEHLGRPVSEEEDYFLHFTTMMGEGMQDVLREDMNTLGHTSLDVTYSGEVK